MSKITLEDYITASGKYPERLKSPELTDEIKKSAQALLDKVNPALEEYGIKAKVSSGFRPTAVNSKTPGASKKSNHLTGHAIDLEDADGKIDAILLKNIVAIEKKYGLYLESPDHTKGWAHLQNVKTKSNPFKP